MNSTKKYIITVSEPWDFESPDGKNIIKGIIMSIVNNRTLVFKANYTLNFNGLRGDILILSPRLKHIDFNSEKIDDVDINGGLLLIDYKNELEENNLKDNCKFVLIGALNGQN